MMPLQPVATGEVIRIDATSFQTNNSIRKLARRATGKVTFEGPVLEDTLELSALLKASRRTGQGTALINAHVMDPTWNYRPDMVEKVRLDATLGLYDWDGLAPIANARWGHAKTYSAEGADGLRAILANTPLRWRSLCATDIAVTLRSNAARALAHLTTAGMSGKAAEMGQAADDALLAGAIVNDPLANRWHLTDTVNQMIDRAGTRVDITLKGLDHVPTTHRIIDAHRRGVAVNVAVRDLAPEDAKLLEDAGVPTKVLSGRFWREHANIIRADDLTYVGSAFPWAPMWHDGATAIEFSNATRDIGLLLGGSDAIEVADVAAKMKGRFRLLSIDAARLAGKLVHSV